ncbi:MAG TPA: asparaginase [Anaerolineales bacterium]|nr:asparaginase [Anaerolineales bacterium]
MMAEGVVPVFELTRGNIVESIHYGAIAVVDAQGRLLYSYGDPHRVAFLRSSAKPFQALPFFERGGHEALGLSGKEQALICASHEGSDEHVRAAASIQAKAKLKESDLQCGVHMPGDVTAYRALIAADEAPTANRNNCSGKHSGMLALAKLRGLPLNTYLELSHPIQQDILTALGEMSGYPREKVEVGIDGCSAPNFGVPLYNAALAFARLCDPRDLPERRQQACRSITEAMTQHPEMISGPGEFDCELMRALRGRAVCKRGAEGFQALGIMPGVIAPEAPGVGIAFKVSDGDPEVRTHDLEPRNRVRPAVALEILRQVGAISPSIMDQLSGFGPELPLLNHRGITVGTSRPSFRLTKAA